MNRGELWAGLNLLGLLCSFTGGILLFYSLSIRSSDYPLVETTDHRVAICLNNLIVASAYGGPLVVTDERCPQGLAPAVAAVVEAERPKYFHWGLGLIALGFLFQLPFACLPFCEKTIFS